MPPAKTTLSGRTWSGLVGLALAPAVSFAIALFSYSVKQDQRVTVLEITQIQLVEAVKSLAGSAATLARIEERQGETTRRLERIEAQVK